MPETVVHFQIRMPPVLHEQLASWAKEDKASLERVDRRNPRGGHQGAREKVRRTRIEPTCGSRPGPWRTAGPAASLAPGLSPSLPRLLEPAVRVDGPRRSSALERADCAGMLEGLFPR